MNRKRMAKKVLRMFRYSLPVRIDYGYYIEYDLVTDQPCAMGVLDYKLRPSTPQEFRMFLAIIHYHESLNLSVSEHFFAIMHEVGHLATDDNLDQDEYVKDVSLLKELYIQGLLDEDSYIIQYNNVEAETKANEWASNWIKNNEKLAKMLDSQLN